MSAKWLSSELFTYEQFIHLFPSIFGIVLCFFSKLDHYWIDWKVQTEIGGGAQPDPGHIGSAKQIANGSAALNIHFVNVLLFIAGAIFAVLDWPQCMTILPLTACVVLFCWIFYEVLITAFPTRFDRYDREPQVPSTSRLPVWRWFRRRPVSAQLRWEQIAFNLIIIALIVVGVMLGGANDHRDFCKAEGAVATPKSTY